MKTLVKITLLICFHTTLIAQPYFRVVLSGMVKNSINKWVVPGSILNKNHTVQIKPKGILMMEYSEGGTVYISKTGIYKVAQLEEKLWMLKNTSRKNAVVYEVHDDTNRRIFPIRRYFRKVRSSIAGHNHNPNPIKLMVNNEGSRYYQPEIKIRWETRFAKQVHQVVLINEFEEIIYTEETKDTSLSLNLAKLKLTSKVLLLSISLKANANQKSYKHAITNIKVDERYEDFKKEYVAFQKQKSNKKTQAFYILEEAYLFEKYACYFDALACLKQAIKLSGGQESYRLAYRLFVTSYFRGF